MTSIAWISNDLSQYEPKNHTQAIRMLQPKSTPAAQAHASTTANIRDVSHMAYAKRGGDRGKRIVMGSAANHHIGSRAANHARERTGGSLQPGKALRQMAYGRFPTAPRAQP